MLLAVLIGVSLLAGFVNALASSRDPFRVLVSRVGTGVTSSSVSGAARRKGLQGWLAACRHPTAATALVLCLALVVSIGGWLLLGLLAFLVRTRSAFLDFDSSVARWASTHGSELSTRGLDVVTSLGDIRVALGLAALLLLVEAAKRGLGLRVIVFLAAVIAGNELITTVVKNLVDRARPALNPVAHTLGPSFPSGHSSTAAAFFGAAALILARGRSHRTVTVLTSLAVVIAVAVACSRVFLDVHWLSDVVAGLALGWAWLTFCALVFGGPLLVAAESTASAPSDGASTQRAGVLSGETAGSGFLP
jgi:undecaprenyl-diphosphatase